MLRTTDGTFINTAPGGTPGHSEGKGGRGARTTPVSARTATVLSTMPPGISSCSIASYVQGVSRGVTASPERSSTSTVHFLLKSNTFLALPCMHAAGIRSWVAELPKAAGNGAYSATLARQHGLEGTALPFLCTLAHCNMQFQHTLWVQTGAYRPVQCMRQRALYCKYLDDQHGYLSWCTGTSRTETRSEAARATSAARLDPR